MEASHHHHQSQTTDQKSSETKHGVNGDHHKQHSQHNHRSPPSPQQQPVTISSPASPPSSSSSPSHEFSFAISLHSSSTKPSKKSSKTNATPSSAIDLSPADDIFFHGHLLPLHLLSAASAAAAAASPRSSTNSLDSFTLPIDDFHPQNDDVPMAPQPPRSTETTTSKPKSFSLFNKWRKATANHTNDDKEAQRKRKKLRFELSQALKRYMRMVRPLLFFRKGSVDLRRQPYSFSGVLSSRDLTAIGRKGPGEYSAPASMRTSPTNSGLLVAAAPSDSTMEELQAAIQAAIAHCKNSIAATTDDKSRLVHR